MNRLLHLSLILAVAVFLGCKSRSPEQLRRLVSDLHSSDGAIRNQAALAIGEFGEDAKSAVPDLIRLLNTDKSRGIRTSAAFALRQIGTKEAISALDSYKE